MAYQYSGRTVLIHSASTSTSAPWYVGDFQRVSFSWQSNASLGPSRFTIEGSNADGLRASDFGNASQTTNWSLISGVNIIGRPSETTTFELGVRWIRVTVAPANHSVASAVSITVNGQSW